MVKVELRSLRDWRGQAADESPGHYKAVKDFVRLYSEAQARCARAFQRNDEAAALQAIRDMRALECRIMFRTPEARPA